MGREYHVLKIKENLSSAGVDNSMPISASDPPDLQQQAVNTVPAKLSKSVRSGFDQPPYSCFGVGGAVAVGLKRWRDRAKTGGRRRRAEGPMLP